MQQIYTLIHERTGLVLNDIRRKEIARHLEKIQKGKQDYLATLQDAPMSHDLWQDVIRIATIGETYFFRNAAHFQALRYHILPMLIAQRRAKGTLFLRLWNAGCATGEEPYSLAILLRELIPDIERWSIMLLATDLNTHFLKLASRGQYTSSAFRNETPDYVAGRWFEQTAPRTYHIKPEVKQMVTFAPLNLISDAYPSLVNSTAGVDLIMCRNVTIYFERAETIAVVNRFYKALGQEGWLIVGHAEPQPVVYDAFKTQYFDRAVLYRKEQEIQPVKPFTPVATPIEPVIVRTPTPAPVVAPAPVATDLMSMAHQAADQENWTQALTLLDQAEADDMFNTDVYYLRGLIYQQIGEELKAVAAFRQAIYCDPKFALAHYALGELYAKQNEMKEAGQHWRRAKKALHGVHAEHLLQDDLTVEMLDELLAYRLKGQ